MLRSRLEPLKRGMGGDKSLAFSTSRIRPLKRSTMPLVFAGRAVWERSCAASRDFHL
jgi:hypothetical protein